MTAAATGDLSLAIAGNPNTGKSTLFNRLTGAQQRVGNYPGITVERMTGPAALVSRRANVVDLPGAYSLTALSPDERVVLDVLSGRVADTPRPDVVVCVVDATNLRRNLFLASQISELGLPIVVALNMADAAERLGVAPDPSRLAERLGVPVVKTVATEGRGLDDLRAAVEEAAERRALMKPVPWPDAVLDAARDIGLRELFDSDHPAREKLRAAGYNPMAVEALHRYKHIDALLEGVVKRPDTSDAYRIDRLLTHRLLGLVIFAAMMFAVFASIYWLAQPLMDLIESGFAALGDALGPRLEATPMLRSLVVDGALSGVAAVVIFLPQILILFFFIAVLEDSGYMARAAFLMDRVFAWCGLNGKSFVPMLSSFACAVPSIMGARTIEDPKARLSTILVSPLMSCSARLPVYVLMIGAFITPVHGAIWGGAALFAMHMLGLVVAIPIAWAVNRFLLRMRPVPFILEMPPYRRPRLKDVLLRMVRSGREFVVRAGTVIFAFSIVIWALAYFPAIDAPTPGERIEQSYLGRAGKAVQPVFEPAGFDWKMTVGTLASFPAREVIVSTLSILYSAEDEERLGPSLAAAKKPDGRPVYSLPVALAVMVFFAFCLQCGSTVAVIAREAGWTWAGFAFLYMTALAWVGAVVAYQVAS